jgi:hypothetical protein
LPSWRKSPIPKKKSPRRTPELEEGESKIQKTKDEDQTKHISFCIFSISHVEEIKLFHLRIPFQDQNLGRKHKQEKKRSENDEKKGTQTTFE